MADNQWMTSAQLAAELNAAGIRTGNLVMAHTRMSAFPWMVGGSEGFLRALLTAVSPTGTITAYAGWEDNPYHLAKWPAERQTAYRAGMPPFNRATSEARRSYGRLPERIRTWPGAHRSAHPEMNLVAVGPLAEWLTASTLDDDPWGPHSPLARVAEADGTVLMLGAPLDTVTIIHHAERIAAVEPKRWVAYDMPVLIGGRTDGRIDGRIDGRTDGRTEWRRFHAIDTSRGAYDYPLEGGYVEVIARAALAAGVGRQVTILGAECHLFPAGPLVEHAVSWIEDCMNADHAGRRALTD